MDTWVAEPEEPLPRPPLTLYTRVVRALSAGRPPDEYLDAQRARHLAAMRRVTAARRSAESTQDALLADYQLFHMEADLRWIEHAQDRLTAWATEGHAAEGQAEPDRT